MLAWFRIYVNPCIPGGIRVKTLQNLICLSSKHLGVLKNLFKRVCAFQIDLKFASVGFWGEGKTPGAPLTYFNDGGVRQRFIFYTPKNPNFRICLPKKIPTFFSIPKKIPQCFCISKFYYLSSGKLKNANFNFVKGLELSDLLNISLWIRCAWNAGNYFSHRLQKYPVIPHKQ